MKLKQRRSAVQWVKDNPFAFTVILLSVPLWVFFGAHGGTPANNNFVLSGENFADKPWVLFTYSFMHVGLLHLILNMSAVFTLVGAKIASEGQKRIASVYLIGVITAGIAILFGGKAAVGASGAIFALVGYMLIRSKISEDRLVAIILICMNLPLNFIPNISWKGHLGGLIGGMLFALVVNIIDTVKATKHATDGIPEYILDANKTVLPYRKKAIQKAYMLGDPNNLFLSIVSVLKMKDIGYSKLVNEAEKDSLQQKRIMLAYVKIIEENKKTIDAFLYEWRDAKPLGLTNNIKRKDMMAYYDKVLSAVDIAEATRIVGKPAQSF